MSEPETPTADASAAVEATPAAGAASATAPGKGAFTADPAIACPCGSKRTLGACCLPVLRGERDADTAEALLRARYSAYVVGAVDFVVETHHARTRGDLQREGVEAWSQQSTWLGLEVLGSDQGGASDETGTVRFRARYRQKGTTFNHDEHASFEREGGKWRFVDAWTPPFRTDAPKVGRNDPCPCGSGKKSKKCCAA